MTAPIRPAIYQVVDTNQNGRIDLDDRISRSGRTAIRSIRDFLQNNPYLPSSPIYRLNALLGENPTGRGDWIHNRCMSGGPSYDNLCGLTVSQEVLDFAQEQQNEFMGICLPGGGVTQADATSPLNSCMEGVRLYISSGNR